MNDCTTCKHIERNPEDQPCANCSRLLDRAASPNYYEPEETQTKHTSGQLRAVGSDPDTDIAPVIVDRDGNPVAEVPIYSDNRNGHSQGTALAVANAERLALAWNCHDPLVAACTKAANHLENAAKDIEIDDEGCECVTVDREWLHYIIGRLDAALTLTRDH